ncbi:MAG: hypothetical protein ACHQJ4_03110 [Ignavibacteria bacterium]
MNIESFKKLIETLKSNSFEIKFECHIFQGKSHVRGIYIYNSKNKDSVKSVLDKEALKEIKFGKTLTWYLGDRKEIILLKFSKEIEIEIPELEQLKVSNYSLT